MTVSHVTIVPHHMALVTESTNSVEKNRPTTTTVKAVVQDWGLVALHTSCVLIDLNSFPFQMGELGMRLPHLYHVALGCDVETICGKSMTVGWSFESKRMLNSLKSQ